VQIFLVGQSRLAKVDLIVDDAGQQVQTRGIDNFIVPRRGGRVDTDDLRPVDQDVGLQEAAWQDTVGVSNERAHESRDVETTGRTATEYLI
jgi:hypothetical protein